RADISLMASELRRTGDAAYFPDGPISYISSLTDRAPCPPIERYVERIKAAALAREAITLGNQLIARTYEGADPIEQIVAEHEQAVSRLGQTNPSRPKGGLYTLDELENIAPAKWLVEGILARGQITMSVGESGSFKSFFALDLSLDLAHAGAKAVYV